MHDWRQNHLSAVHVMIKSQKRIRGMLCTIIWMERGVPHFMCVLVLAVATHFQEYKACAAYKQGVKSLVDSTLLARRHRLRRADRSSCSTQSWRRTTALLAAPWKSTAARCAQCHRPTACPSMTCTWRAPMSSSGSARYGCFHLPHFHCWHSRFPSRTRRLHALDCLS